MGGYWAQWVLWRRSGTSRGEGKSIGGNENWGLGRGWSEASPPPALFPSVPLFLVWGPLHFLCPAFLLASSLSSLGCLRASPPVVGPARGSPLPAHASPQTPPSLSPLFLPAICLPVYCPAASSKGQGEAGAEAGSPGEVRGLQVSGGWLPWARGAWVGAGGRCQDCCP